MSESIKVPAGSSIRMGQAAKPLPMDVQTAIKSGLSEIDGVVEAYLPMCQLGNQAPNHALIVGFRNNDAIVAGMPKVADILKRAIETLKRSPETAVVAIDLLPMVVGDPIVKMARGTKSTLLAAPVKPWWKFW